MGENTPFPFVGLGKRLRKCRELMHESMAEVSGAVEIDVETLSKIEQGILQPSEEVLLLLISHLGISEDDAAGLWELAGYDKSQENSDAEQIARQLFMVVPFDNRVLFTDGSSVSSNQNGVTISFSQTAGGESAVVSRIGMSREHAWELMSKIQESLIAKPAPATKYLPAPKYKKHTTD